MADTIDDTFAHHEAHTRELLASPPADTMPYRSATLELVDGTGHITRIGFADIRELTIYGHHIAGEPENGYGTLRATGLTGVTIHGMRKDG